MKSNLGTDRYLRQGGEWAFSIFFINFLWDSPLISVNKFRVPS